MAERLQRSARGAQAAEELRRAGDDGVRRVEKELDLVERSGFADRAADGAADGGCGSRHCVAARLRTGGECGKLLL